MTPKGRLAAAALMIVGITLFAAITSTVTSYIIARRRGETGETAGDATDLIRKLGQLHAEGHISTDEFEGRRLNF